jgi:hypothetical protein
MNDADLQSWCGLPDHFKRQAAPDMLAGKVWWHWGKKIEHPGEAELLRWAGDSAPSKASMPPAPETRTQGDSGAIGKAPRPRTIQEKRRIVRQALNAHPEKSNRAIARELGLSHTFVAIERKRCQLENVNI